MRRIYEVVRQRMVHLVAQLVPAGGDNVVVLRHQVPQETVDGQLALLRVVLVGLVLRDYVFGSGRVRVRVEDLVKAGVALGLVQEVDELGCCHVLLRPNTKKAQVFAGLSKSC
jgi:hypothetical protein